jgi:hypothetical protein
VYADVINNESDTIYIEIDPNANDLKEVFSIIIKERPNEFDEISKNIFRFWWD